MNNFWTVLLFTMLEAPLDGGTSGMIYYPSMEACLAAHQIVSKTLPYDHKVNCVETSVMSSSMRPKPRPEGLGGQK